MSEVKLLLGDCLELMKDIPDKSIDAVITDIPYNETNRESNGLRILDKGTADSAIFDIDKLLIELDRICAGSIYAFCGFTQYSKIDKYFRENRYSRRCIVWEKTNPSPMNGQHIWLSSVECCVYGKFRNATFNEHCKGSVLNFSCGRGKIHPTEKPIKLFEYIVSVSSNEGDLVLDPFAGGGTTAIACKNKNRNWILIEKDPEYYKMAEIRIKG